MNPVANRRALIVDDQGVTRFATRVITEELGFEVDEAQNSADAVEKAVLQCYQLILLDFDMPGVNGAECAKQIRQLDNFSSQNTVIFCLSASSDPQIKEACLEAGMDGYIERPCLESNLAAAIDGWSAAQ